MLKLKLKDSDATFKSGTQIIVKVGAVTTSAGMINNSAFEKVIDSIVFLEVDHYQFNGEKTLAVFQFATSKTNQTLGNVALNPALSSLVGQIETSVDDGKSWSTSNVDKATLSNNRIEVVLKYAFTNTKTLLRIKAGTLTFTANGNSHGNINPTLELIYSDYLKSLKIGDYIQFGKYNNTPILWRVIQKDEEDHPILLSDRIISLKPFDAPGAFYVDDATRLVSGSNYYHGSNIRQWLNSSSSNQGVDAIDWLQNDPSYENMPDGYNHYSQEKGFLAEGNFNAEERALLKSFSHKVALSELDSIKADGGTQNLNYVNDLANVVQNYHGVFYQNIEDRVFLLSVQQLKEWVYDNRSVLGDDYHIAKPTLEAGAQIIY